MKNNESSSGSRKNLGKEAQPPSTGGFLSRMASGFFGSSSSSPTPKSEPLTQKPENSTPKFEPAEKDFLQIFSESEEVLQTCMRIVSEKMNLVELAKANVAKAEFKRTDMDSAHKELTEANGALTKAEEDKMSIITRIERYFAHHKNDELFIDKLKEYLKSHPYYLVTMAVQSFNSAQLILLSTNLAKLLSELDIIKILYSLEKQICDFAARIEKPYDFSSTSAVSIAFLSQYINTLLFKTKYPLQIIFENNNTLEGKQMLKSSEVLWSAIVLGAAMSYHEQNKQQGYNENIINRIKIVTKEIASNPELQKIYLQIREEELVDAAIKYVVEGHNFYTDLSIKQDADRQTIKSACNQAIANASQDVSLLKFFMEAREILLNVTVKKIYDLAHAAIEYANNGDNFYEIFDIRPDTDKQILEMVCNKAEMDADLNRSKIYIYKYLLLKKAKEILLYDKTKILYDAIKYARDGYDFYRDLDIKQYSTREEIEDAYRKNAAIPHQDSSKLKRLNLGKGILLCENAKKLYDEALRRYVASQTSRWRDAAYHGKVEEMESLLKTNPYGVLTQDNEKRTPLHNAVCQGHDVIVALLLKCSIKPVSFLSLQDDEGNTPFHLAIKKGNLKTIEFLLKAGALINLQNDDGQTPLHIAVLEGNSEIVRLLLDAKADANIGDKNGNTPLHIAASLGLGQGSIIALLSDLNNGAYYEVLNNDNMTPIQLAENKGHSSVVALLLYHNRQREIEGIEACKQVKAHEEAISQLRQQIDALTKQISTLSPSENSSPTLHSTSPQMPSPFWSSTSPPSSPLKTSNNNSGSQKFQAAVPGTPRK